MIEWTYKDKAKKTWVQELKEAYPPDGRYLAKLVRFWRYDKRPSLPKGPPETWPSSVFSEPPEKTVRGAMFIKGYAWWPGFVWTEHGEGDYRRRLEKLARCFGVSVEELEAELTTDSYRKVQGRFWGEVEVLNGLFRYSPFRAKTNDQCMIVKFYDKEN